MSYSSIKPAVVYEVYTGIKFRSIIRTLALLWCRRAKLERTTCVICNTEYQDELIHVISECTCTVRQRDRFKNHILPSYKKSIDVMHQTLPLTKFEEEKSDNSVGLGLSSLTCYNAITRVNKPSYHTTRLN